jgi:hypothetical protein
MKLPPGIRRTIYGLAGLEQDTKETFIDLNYWNYREPTTPFEDGCSADAEFSGLSRLYVNWKSRIPVNLFQVSRAIHDEVEEIFYRSHIWGVSASGAGGLDVLEGLSPESCDSYEIPTHQSHPLRMQWLRPDRTVYPSYSRRRAVGTAQWHRGTWL